MLLSEAPQIGAGDAALRSHVRPVLVLVALCLALFLPGIARIPAVDADEGRFVQATKQMVETGNFIDIRLQDVPRSKKPIGIHWLQSAAVLLSGQGAEAPIWVYRLPSLLGALSAVLLTYWAGLALFGQRAAFVAAALLGASVVLIVEAHLAKTDAALVATVVAAQGVLARLYSRDAAAPLPLGFALVFWAALGAGVLLKGPLILMIVGLTILALVVIERGVGWLRGLRPLLGIVIVGAMAAPWLGLTLARSGTEFLQESVGNDLLGKVFGGQEGHAAPPGTHSLLFWTTFWPGSLLVALSIPWVWRHRGERAVRFCLAWIIPSLIVFEIATTKLPHYTLPLLPAAALLVGGAVMAGGVARGPWVRWAFAATALVPVVVVLVGFGIYWSLVGAPPIWASVAAVVSVALSSAAAVLAAKNRLAESFGFVVGSLFPLVVAIMAGVIPSADRLWPAREMAEVLPEAANCPDPAIAVAGFGEASVPFELGTRTQLVDGASAAILLAEPGCRVVFVEEREGSAFLTRARELGMSFSTGPTVQGLNLTFMRRMALTAYRNGGGN